ncbi:hypothetical protein [Streptomyces beihaiensis]|uniref:Uncharacterized protein n=1 Tax=Streptomyces beihaiensis TaxID=2984495 RepID=A0ABT3U317_9ACTN|nr:hypothetical protein [Streptomyces beihaiensis]MCX3062997.1 hypothetical protein [Streptomyces beihaiensis]
MTEEPHGDAHHNTVSGQSRVGSLVQAGRIDTVHVHGPASDEPPPPRQLRPEVPNFVDRKGEQQRFERCVRDRRGDGDRPLVVVLSGLSGVGKTTLGFRLARRFAKDVDRAGGRCGVLYVDLAPLRRDGVVEPYDALDELLRSLGVDPEWLGSTEEARLRQFWRHTAAAPFVVVADNVRYAGEIEPLLPSCPGSVVIVASHGPLYDLEDADAVELPLAPLPLEHAVELLTKAVGRAGAARLGEEPEAVRELAALCEGLPAALRVVAARLRGARRRLVAHVAEEFRTQLREEGVPLVEAVWTVMYLELSEPARRCYELLGTVGSSLPLEAVGAAVAPGEAAADGATDAIVEELEGLGLVEVRDGRLVMHALVREHAARRARDADRAAVARSARERLVRWYLRQAQRADLVAAGKRLSVSTPEPAVAGTAEPALSEAATAYGWLETERHALRRCLRIAYDDRLDAQAWALCEPLWTHHLNHPRHRETSEAFRIGLAAARRAENLAARVRMACQLARLLWEQGEYDEAERELDTAVAAAGLLSDTDDDRKLAASALEFRGRLNAERGRWAAALPDYEAARAVHERIENRYGVMLQNYQLGKALTALGRTARALDLLETAHAQARDLARDRMTGRTALALGRVLELRRQENGRARELYGVALASARRRNAPADQLGALDALARIAAEGGDASAAAEYREAAARIRTRRGETGEG